MCVCSLRSWQPSAGPCLRSNWWPASPGSQVHLLLKVVSEWWMTFSETQNCWLYLQTIHFSHSVDPAPAVSDCSTDDALVAITPLIKVSPSSCSTCHSIHHRQMAHTQQCIMRSPCFTAFYSSLALLGVPSEHRCHHSRMLMHQNSGQIND